MKKITKKKSDELCNGVKILTDAELKAIAEILDAVENIEYRQWKHINGGYAEVEMFNYDDDFIDAELTSGEQDMGGGQSQEYKSQLKIPREILLNKMSLKKKLEHVNW